MTALECTKFVFCQGSAPDRVLLLKGNGRKGKEREEKREEEKGGKGMKGKIRGRGGKEGDKEGRNREEEGPGPSNIFGKFMLLILSLIHISEPTRPY